MVDHGIIVVYSQLTETSPGFVKGSSSLYPKEMLGVIGHGILAGSSLANCRGFLN